MYDSLFPIYDSLSPGDATTVQERVYQSLRLALLRGQFLPGDQVSIRGLANAFGTSPMPVREAVKRLVAEKGLEQSSDRLIRVSPYIGSVHEEYIRIRIQVEGFATERACRISNPQLVDRLRSFNQNMLTASQSNDMETALISNQSFHFEIYRAAHYPQLLDIISNLWLRTGPFLATAQRNPELFERVFATGFEMHDRAVEAFARHDRAEARRAIALDIRSAHFWIRKYYEANNFSMNIV